MANVIEIAKPYEGATLWYYRYSVNPDRELRFSLSDLKRDFARFTSMSDDEFSQNLVQAAHFACIVAYYKNLEPVDTVADIGIVHNLIHLMHHRHTDGFSLSRGFDDTLKSVRADFERLLKL